MYKKGKNMYLCVYLNYVYVWVYVIFLGFILFIYFSYRDFCIVYFKCVYLSIIFRFCNVYWFIIFKYKVLYLF